METDGTLISDQMVTISAAQDYWVVLRTYQDQILQAEVSGIGISSSAIVDVAPNQYMKLVIQAPGEELAPGIFADQELDGKLGTPLAQDVGVPFDVTVFATDYYHNPISESDIALPISIDFSSSDLAAILPSNPQVLSDNDREFPITLLTLTGPGEHTVTIDDIDRAIDATTVVPVVAGTLDHFDIGINNSTIPYVDDVLEPIPDLIAGGILSNVTVIARDVFGNHIASFADSISLLTSFGDEAINPSRISMASGFNGSGDEFGVWRGSISITRADTNISLLVEDDIYSRIGISNEFDVFAGTYADLQLIFEGEITTPGVAPGKIGLPLPVTAGDTISAVVTAVDQFWNPVLGEPWVHFASDNYFDMVSLNDTQLEADGSSDFDILLRTATTHSISVSDLTFPSYSDSSSVTAGLGVWEKMVLVTPGETHEPGGYEPDGKIGTPAEQVASLQFSITAQATDKYWNSIPIDGGIINLVASDGTLDATNPINNNQPLVAGQIVFPIASPNLGVVDVEVSNSEDSAIEIQSVPIEVTLGAGYRITVSDTVLAGPPELFEMTVEMVDEFGAVLTNAQNIFYMTALTSGLNPSDGNLQITEAQLIDGAITLVAQAFDTAGNIFIQVSDDAGRTNLSQLIRVNSNDVIFDVTVDTSSPVIAGQDFAVTVQLLDTQTGTVVPDNRSFSIGVLDESGMSGIGRVGIVSQQLNSGSVTFNQTYTRSENISLQVWADTLVAQSVLFTIDDAGYQRIQILAPGETLEPGADLFIDTDGKSGAPVQQRASEPFIFSVYATDMFFNHVDSVNSGVINLASNDNAYLITNNPVFNDIVFTNGVAEFSNFLIAQGSIVVTASDTLDASLITQSVTIETAPAYIYSLITPETAQTGSAPGFSMSIQLVDPITGELVVTEENTIYLEPAEPAIGVLSVTSTWLSSGAAVVSEQSYSELEELSIKVSDDFGRTGISSVIEMQSSGLYFEVTVPDSVVVGDIFDIDVRLVDSNTGSTVTTMDGPVAVSVFDAVTGLPGSGELGIVQQILVDGQCTISQTYTLSGSSWFEIIDTNNSSGISNSCLFAPGEFIAIQVVPPGGFETPDVQQSGIPFSVEIVAIDSWLNQVDIDDGELSLTTELPATVTLVNPDDLDAPFINGSRFIDLILEGTGSVLLQVEDLTRPMVNSGAVSIPTNEAQYQIILPDPAVVTTGPP
ncbi:hypothetical protein HN843_06005, partial [bacterium]|nr:hypothetical protein [bacterium]